MNEVNDRPLISYVVTAYNIENYIAEAVQCAFDQTYSPLEIILSDDCSTDETFEIMKRMAASYEGPHKVVLNRNEINLGITRHMNKAFLKLSSGEVIVVAHGDDISSKDRLRIMGDYLAQNPQVMQVACSAVVVNELGVEYDAYTQRNFHVNEVMTYGFGSGAHVSIGFSAFRKDVMRYFGPLSAKCPTEDDPIGFRAIMLGNIAYLPDRLVTYRKHAGSNSRPELFEKFPIDEIYNQNLTDMMQVFNGGVFKRAIRDGEKSLVYK